VAEEIVADCTPFALVFFGYAAVLLALSFAVGFHTKEGTVPRGFAAFDPDTYTQRGQTLLKAVKRLFIGVPFLLVLFVFGDGLLCHR
jgi:hypothetical protein